MALMEIDDETWKALKNPHVRLRPSHFQNEEEDIHLNVDTFERAVDSLYYPLDKTETDNQDNSYMAYMISSQEGKLLSSNYLGYIYEECVELLFPRAYIETRRKGQGESLRVFEQ